MDNLDLDYIKKEFYKVCSLDFIRELIVSVFGPESKTYANRFYLTDSLAIKYKMIVLDNINFIQNKKICDVGCNSGLWPIVFAMHGATSVIGVEPRPFFHQGSTSFIQKHNLPIKMIVGDHKTTLQTINKQNIETIVMMNIDDIVPNFEDFIHNCVQSKIKNYILQCTTVSDEVLNFPKAPNQIGLSLYFKHHNTDLRGGMNQYEEVIDDDGFQSLLDDSFDIKKTEFLKNFRSEDYIRYILQSNNLQIISDKKPKISDKSFAKNIIIHPSICYHWLTATKI